MSTDRRTLLRPHAEQAYAHELDALAAADDKPRPPQWKLSPWAVRTYLLGGTLADGTVITPKYIGSEVVIEQAIVTLDHRPRAAAARRARHRQDVGLRAPRRRDLRHLAPGSCRAPPGPPRKRSATAGTTRKLLAEGPSPDALVESPVMTGMRDGAIVRVEELTRVPSEVQDALITILSEKTLAGAGARHRGAGPQGLQRDRHRQQPRQGRQRPLERAAAPLQHRRAAAAGDGRGRGRDRLRARREPRRGAGAARHAARGRSDPPGRARSSASCATASRSTGTPSSRRPSGTLSTAEAISVMTNGWAHAAHFGDGEVGAAELAARRGRRGHPGPGAGPRRLPRVPGDRRQGARRLARPVPRLARAAVRTVLGIRHHGPGLGAVAAGRARRARARRGADRGARRTRPSC